MDTTELLNLTSADPFMPFTITLIDQRQFVVNDPNEIRVTATSTLLFAGGDGTTEPFRQWILINPTSISSVQPSSG